MNTDSLTVPAHIGFILDGNRRWAAARGLKPIDGHKAGYKVLRTIAKECFDQGVSYVTAYVFSTENWKRTKKEVDWLMNFAQWAADHEVEDLAKDGIRLRILGTDDNVAQKLASSMHKAEAQLADNERGTLALCFNYDGRREIMDAVRQLIREGAAAEAVDETSFAERLYAPDIPDIDLVVRTSGEQRISNFMLWRIAYAEFKFVAKHWPDFDVSDLREVLADYSRRQRRHGQ